MKALTLSMYVATMVALSSCFGSELLIRKSDGLVACDVTGQNLVITDTEVISHGSRLNRSNIRLVKCEDVKLEDNVKIYLSSLTNVSQNVKITNESYALYKQNAKSDLHKEADTELVELLIESGDLVAGSVKTKKGDHRKATKRLLKASKGQGHGKKADRDRSIHISQIQQIIISEGGDPDDAIVHPEI